MAVNPNPPTSIKGAPTYVFRKAGSAGLSDVGVDCRGYNAVLVQVYPEGSSPTATVSVEGAPSEGGPYIQLPDSQASRAGVTTATAFDVVTGSAWVRVRLASVTGTYTVVVTPYQSPGSTNPLSGTTTVDTELPAAAALADNAANPTAPAVGAFLMALDSATWDRMTGSAANGLDVDVTRVSDGADVALGATADAAVVTDASGTVSGKLRGLVKMLADVWTDAANALGVVLRNGSGTEIGTAAAPVRTDPTGTTTQPVSDASGSLTVDATDLDIRNLTSTDVVTVTGGVGQAADVKVTLDSETVVLAASDGTDIGNVDVASVVPGTGATNLGKAIDAVAGATDTGVAPLAIRDDALAALTPIEGDYVPLRTDANGALWVHDDALDAALSGSELQVDVVSIPTVAVTGPLTDTQLRATAVPISAASLPLPAGASNSTAQVTAQASLDTIEGALTIGPVPVSATDLDIRNLTSTDVVTVTGGVGQAADVKVTLDSETVVLAASDGTDIGNVDVASVVPGTGATNLGKAIDAVAGATDTGVAPLAIRDDALAALTPIEGDYVPLRTDANGALWVHDDALDAALSGSELQVDVVAALPAGTAVVGKVGVDQTTPGTTNLVESRPSARRNAGALHRDGITAVDKLSAPGNPTLADVTTGGALLANTTYYVGILAVVLQGGSAEILGLSTVNASIQSQATAADASNTHIIRTTFSQVTNADAYLLFCSTDAAPKLVGYVTEAQRAAGGVLTAFGTVGAGGVAGAIDISLAGTGLQTSNAVFTINTAHMPDTVAAVGAVACQGYSKAICTVRAQLSKATVWSAAPALTLTPWLKTQEGSADWAAGSPITLSLLGAASDALTQVFEVDVTGAVGLVLTCSTITGLASFDAWVELA